MALFNALQQWLDSGSRPTIAAIEADCAQQARQFGDARHFNASFQPQPLFSREHPR